MLCWGREGAHASGNLSLEKVSCEGGWKLDQACRLDGLLMCLYSGKVFMPIRDHGGGAAHMPGEPARPAGTCWHLDAGMCRDANWGPRWRRWSCA